MEYHTTPARAPQEKVKENQRHLAGILHCTPYLCRRGVSIMATDYSYLRDHYPPVITLDQLYRICHISKRKAKWLLENHVIPCQDSRKKTRRFKIQLEDVIHYLEELENGNQIVLFPKGFFSSHCIPKPTAQKKKMLRKLARPDIQKEIYHYFEKKFASFPDALTTAAVAQMTGYGRNAVNRWIQTGHLKVYSRGDRFIPKTFLLEFCCSAYYIRLCSLSPDHEEDMIFLRSLSA